MAVHILDAMAREGFEEVVAIHDRASGLRAFVGIHDTSAGPAFGGIRRYAYRDERSALIDCLRLSRAMTRKCALAGIEGGGGKIVVVDSPDLERAGAYRHLGRAVERLAGRYYAGPDVGTGEEELGWVAEGTSFVTRPGAEGPGELAPATAAGVFAGMAASLRSLDGEEDWGKRTIVVQGIGSVGGLLARRLLERGARVLGAELDPDRARRAEALGVECVEAGSELEVECDVFAPCAMGGGLHDLSISRLRSRIVCGSANNPLAHRQHGELLHERGVLYVPDVVVSAGAVLRGSAFHLQGAAMGLEEIEARIDAVVSRILSIASANDWPPSRAAEEEAARLIETRRRRAAAPPRSLRPDRSPLPT